MTAIVPLHFSEHGTGESIILIHGLGANHEDWRVVAPLLAKRFRVIAPDLRGFGDSPRGRGDYRPSVFAADLLALMDRLDIARAHIVGHSMGGAVALSLALAAPERTQSVLIANSVPSFRPRTPREFAEIGMRLGMMATLGPRRLGRIMGRRMFPGEDQQALRDLVETRAATNSRRVYLASLLALSRWSVTDRLGELTMPVSVIASGRDYFPAEELKRFAATLPNGRFHCFEHARHGLPLEEGEALAEHIAQFIDQTEAATRFRSP